MDYPSPNRLTYLIGDIHGTYALLEPLLTQIEADRGDTPADLVVIGDMIDRGPDSATVLATLQGLSGAVCLKGNHEDMAMNFLDAPRDAGPRWIRNGGEETLASFGITDIHTTRLEDLAQAFSEALGSLEPWLRSLPLSWQSGNLVAAHSGLDPKRSLARQKHDAMIWGRSKFLEVARKDDLWVAHGHWPAESPSCADGRLSIDTGAGRGGSLTAARIDAQGVSYLSVAPE